MTNRLICTVALALAASMLASPTYAASKRKSKKAEAAVNKDVKPTQSNPLAGLDSKQPDKQLYDKALAALKKGHYDVARLELQALLNTYPDSEYQMRAKLSIGDSWYKEGGTAALTQAEAEYKDFITFFPNQPEAAEAQMKVANIYYMQMEKPDRDFQKTAHAEEEYKQMILQFPDSPLVPEAKQKLREVQEVLAQRQFEVASFYLGRDNYPASIARFQTLTDTYPLYSHSDDALIGLGDAYMGEAHALRDFKLPEGARAELIKTYEDQAADAYAKVVTRYPMAAHTDDARDRLAAMNRPVPEPTKEAIAQSEAEEQSHATVKLRDRALLLVSHHPSTVAAVRVGEPTMTEPKPTTAPKVNQANVAAYNKAMHIETAPAEAANAATTSGGNAAPAGDAPAPTSAGQPALEDVPSSDVGATILSTGNTGAGAAAPGTAAPAGTTAAPAGDTASPTGTAARPDDGITPVGAAPVQPENATALPPVDKPAPAADQVNEVKGVQQPAIDQQAKSNGKFADPKFDKSEDSSNKHKKKKGLKKLNPL